MDQHVAGSKKAAEGKLTRPWVGLRNRPDPNHSYISVSLAAVSSVIAEVAQHGHLAQHGCIQMPTLHRGPKAHASAISIAELGLQRQCMTDASARTALLEAIRGALQKVNINASQYACF